MAPCWQMTTPLGGRMSGLASQQDGGQFEDALRRLAALENKLTTQVGVRACSGVAPRPTLPKPAGQDTATLAFAAQTIPRPGGRVFVCLFPQ